MPSPKRAPSDPPPRFAPHVAPSGDSALLLELAAQFDLTANEAARAIGDDVRAAGLDGVTDVVAAIVTVTVHFRASTAEEAATRRAAIGDFLMAARARAQRATAPPREPIDIPVCYQPAFAPDLAAVAEQSGLTPAEVVDRHTAALQPVLMIGFAPGFPYIGGLDPRLATVPRRATPRARVEAGSVAIANGQTAIYPFATPGGWNLIGRTPLRLFDPLREPPALLQAGDRVRFVAIPAREFDRLAQGQAR